jgi:hypothetical protein
VRPFRAPAAALLLGALAACGYEMGGLYPEREVAVRTFDNVSERRTEELDLTNAVVHEMTARGFRVNRSGAPLTLRARIMDVRTPSLVDQQDTDQTLVSSLQVRVEAVLTDAEGKERWREERSERVSFTPARSESYLTARQEAYDRLARWIVTRFEREW